MTYLAICLAALGLVALIPQRTYLRLGRKIARPRMRKGDYDSALRWMRWSSLGMPSVLHLHQEGLILDMAGRLVEAERCYRRAFAMLRDDDAYPRERLHASLGWALLDLGRYGEAQQCFERAIELGDETGSAVDGLAELRLAQGVEAQRALDYVNQAIEQAKRHRGGHVHWVFYGNQARALALLERIDEARESLARALGAAEPGAPQTADLHWRAGMALVTMRQIDEARKHFRIGLDADPRGKYGRRCGELLGNNA